tara:strand:+ start:166 stop:810 length:645 start_codon:yes stop_codon:yes gene_type:complete
MKFRLTENEIRQEEINKIAKHVLQEKYIFLNICESFNIKEKVKENKTEISCQVELKNSEEKNTMKIKGYGEGPIDALFTVLKKKLSKKYCSLDLIRFSEFVVSADIQKSPNRTLNSSGSNAMVEAMLTVNNDRGEDLTFRNCSSSINKAAANVVLQTIEYFINSEKAVLQLHKNITDARDRNRGDLLSRYTSKLSELVKNVSYVETIKRGEDKK